jgi:hypothetical protein
MTTPFNFVTMTQYSGKNAEELAVNDFPAYATFNQIKANGGKVKKGSKGYKIFCGFQKYEKKDKETGETKEYTSGRYAVVFHIDDVELDPGLIGWMKEEANRLWVSA